MCHYSPRSTAEGAKEPSVAFCLAGLKCWVKGWAAADILMKVRVSRPLRSRAAGVVAALMLAATPLLSLAEDAAAATYYRDAIQSQGRQRTFLISAPQGGSRKGLPILMMLHGGLGNGSRAAQQTGLADYVDRLGMLAIFPDAGGTQWNDGRETTEDGLDDVAFLGAVISKAVQTWGGDPSRVFIAGLSNGGIMAQRMACDATQKVTAVGVVSANMAQALAVHCRPSRPIPVILIGSTADRLMPWDGGTIASSPILGGKGGTVISALDTFKLWSTFDGCTQPEVSELAGIPVKRHVAVGCQSGSQVVLYEIDGGAHGWPGGNDLRGPFARRLFGESSKVISASAVLIEFFKQYGL
jgi:polyhydroxybutyrate depolymerase